MIYFIWDSWYIWQFFAINSVLASILNWVVYHSRSLWLIYMYLFVIKRVMIFFVRIYLLMTSVFLLCTNIPHFRLAGFMICGWRKTRIVCMCWSHWLWTRQYIFFKFCSITISHWQIDNYSLSEYDPLCYSVSLWCQHASSIRPNLCRRHASHYIFVWILLLRWTSYLRTKDIVN